MKKAASLLLALTLMLLCAACDEMENDWEVPLADIGETVCYEGNVFYVDDVYSIQKDYTVEQVQIFDRYTDANLPEESFLEQPNDQPFVLIDVKVKKRKGPERQNDALYDTIQDLTLLNGDILDALFDNPSAMSASYFSGYHASDESTGPGYYWLEPGEEASFQIGWCLDDEPADVDESALPDADRLTLCIGSDYAKSKFIDLTGKGEG